MIAVREGWERQERRWGVVSIGSRGGLGETGAEVGGCIHWQ